MKFITYQELATRIENKENLDKIFVSEIKNSLLYNTCKDIPNIVFKPLSTVTVCDLIKDTCKFIDISEEE